MRISVDKVRVGDRLRSDVFNQSGVLVLASDTVLTRIDHEKLDKHDIEYVDILSREYEASPVPGAAGAARAAVVSPERAVSGRFKGYREALEGIAYLFRQAAREELLPEKQLEACCAPLFSRLHQETDVVALLLELNDKDDYTYQHSVQVGMISYYIAYWAGATSEEAMLAGKAGYLHDIGKSQIPADMLKKPGKLTPAEYEEMQRHTVYGYATIRASRLPEGIALAALQHHERYDRSGYPLRLSGEELHPLSKIVAVADIYSAMISNRVYQRQRNLLQVLKELHRCSFGQLDPRLTQLFIRHMAPCFIGKRVTLSSGETGTIVMLDAADYFRPLIRTEDGFLDLSARPELEIEHIYM